MINAFACTEDFLKSLPQPIAIVGNGVPLGPMGPAIDHHPSVIRLNNYRLPGYEALVEGPAAGRHRSAPLNKYPENGLLFRPWPNLLVPSIGCRGRPCVGASCIHGAFE